GTFTTRQHLGSGYFAFAQNAPFGNLINLTNVSISNPWANYAGGNPFPLVLSKNVVFPTFGSYRTDPFGYKPVTLNQWNLSLQKQIAANWLVSANYVGNSTIHLVTSTQLNPAIFMGLGSCSINGASYPVCSTTANTSQRRALYLQNPSQGQYYGGVNALDDGGTASYNGLLLTVQKRLSSGVSALANYTWSHCISDYYEAQVGVAAAVGLPGARRLFRGNCNTGDQRHVFNLSGVVQTPKFANSALRTIASNWQFSPIMKVRSAQFFSVTLGVDAALNGQPTQFPNLVGNPYVSNPSVDGWLDRAAFQTPPAGTVGNLAPNSLKGPGTFQFDLGLSRTFLVREGTSLQLRGEAFNILNHLTPATPVAALNNTASFGKIQSDISGTSGLSAGNQRIIQVALKFVF
ncbi:MAG TPA: carboxypeptidase regulatory-like domain-containing protein, partial [Terriglobia bacterium]|nr:carboxypeptidase regulatory-like domain-containing protein [Terriglobia bacterium]